MDVFTRNVVRRRANGTFEVVEEIVNDDDGRVKRSQVLGYHADEEAALAHKDRLDERLP